MLRTAVAAVALLALGWMALHFLTKVGTADVIAYNDFQRAAEAGSFQVKAGDSVVVYDDGHLERLCDLNIADTSFTETDLSSSYVNTLAESLPFLEQVGAVFQRLLPGEETSAPATRGTSASGTRLDFFGAERSLREIDGAPTTEDCQCRMARFASHGNLVCTVNATLTQTLLVDTPSGPHRASKTVAVTLARHPVYFNPALLEACGVPETRAANIGQQRLCNDGAVSMPLDVLARQRLNLIDERPFTPLAANRD